MISQNIDDATLAYWQSYVNAVKDQMGLRDWVIELQRDAPPDDTHIACIGILYGQKRARLHLDFPCFLAQTPFSRKVTIIHELLHCHTEHLDEFVRDFCNEQDEGTHGFFLRRYQRESEQWVETMSQIIAPWMPDFDLVLGDPPETSLGY